MPDFEILELATLVKVDPAIPLMWKGLVAHATNDCRDRPALAKRRSVIMQIDQIPISDDSGNITEIGYEFLFKSKIPNFVSHLFTGIPTKNGIKFVSKAGQNEKEEAGRD